jgi:AcrR family transcriptional regulator
VGALVSTTSPSPELDDKRARILQAAMEVCERSGVHAARMEEVAARAQVSKGTLYRYFESKEDLFLATIIASYEVGLQAIRPTPEDLAQPRVALAAVFDGLVDVLVSVSPRAQVHYQAWGVVAGTPEYEQRLHDFLRGFHEDRDREFVALIRAGQQSGDFRADADPETIAAGISGLLSGFIYRSAFDPVGADPAVLRACFDTLIGLALEPRPAARPHDEVQEHD